MGDPKKSKSPNLAKTAQNRKNMDYVRYNPANWTMLKRGQRKNPLSTSIPMGLEQNN